jgi:tetratricopeptide (TPR) repeat protein
MYGTLRPAGASKTYNVDVAFVDTRTGDSLPVPQFTVAGDGRDEVREASGQIVTALGSQVDFRRAVLFCQEYLAATQFDDAERNCAQALEINPTSIQALYLMGRVMIGRENWEAAAELLQEVVERSPSNTEALQALAFAHVKLGNTEVAMTHYREFLNFNPGAEDVRLTGHGAQEGDRGRRHGHRSYQRRRSRGRRGRARRRGCVRASAGARWG